MRKPAGRKWAGLMLGAILSVAACSAPWKSPDPTEPNAGPVSPTAARTSGAPTSTVSSKQSLRNDLESGRTARTVRAGEIRVTLEYTLRNRVQNWTPGVAQPLTVRMTALSSNKSDQKIYLSQVTVYLDVSDSRGHVDSPEPLFDRANITPGFLVTSPASYTQVFALPPLPGDATSLTVDIRYEMLRLQRGSGDFAKFSATDTIVITKS